MWLRCAQLNLLTLPLRAYGGYNHHLVFTRVIPINQKCVVGFEPTNGSFADYCVKPLHHTHKTYRGKDNSVGKTERRLDDFRQVKYSTTLSPNVGMEL